MPSFNGSFMTNFSFWANMDNVGEGTKGERWSWAVAFLFFVVVGFLKFQQYRYCQNQAFDLGIYVNTLWNTAHGRFFYLAIRGGENYLGAHFAPLLFVFAPLIRLWPSPLPLVLLQSLSLALAIPAVYRLATRASGRPSVGLGFALWYSVFPFVHQVSRYDFHEVALAVPLFLWLLESWEAKQFRRALWLAVFVVLIREDCILYVAAGALWAATLGEGQSAKTRRYLLVFGVLAAVCFAVVMFVVMPRLASGRGPADFNYGNLGGMKGLAKSLFRPGLLWTESLGLPEKRASLMALCLSTSGLILLAPRRAILVAVPVLVNILGALPAQYRFEQHYSALILPFLFWAMAGGWARGQLWARDWGRWRHRVGILFFAVSLSVCLTHQKTYYISFSKAKREALHQLFSRVPDEDPVHAMTNLVPRFAARPDIRMFPASTSTRWVALGFAPAGFYVSEEDQKAALAFNHRFQRTLVYARENIRLYDLTRLEKP